LKIENHQLKIGGDGAGQDSDLPNFQFSIFNFQFSILLIGQALFVCAIVALSGPGRIDIVDGQTRFEVARNMVEHGDSALRDPRIWWGSFPGRDGLNFTYYRFPQSLLGAGAIRLADWTGPTSEGRRHFFFVLTSAVAAALLCNLYTIAFRVFGHRLRSAALWGLAGIFCTPNWYYGTTTFDEILGTLSLVGAAVTAILTRQRRPLLGAALAGLCLGLAFNCKQTLGAFVAAILAIHDDSVAQRRRRLVRAGAVLAGLALGIGAYIAYDYYKFPFEKSVVHAELLTLYPPVYALRPLTVLACLAISPGCGVFWYCPALILSMVGLAETYKRGERKLVAGLIVSSVIFIGFHCFMSLFKGDIAWGPRYLTPWFGVLWLFAPMGASVLARRLVVTVLASGFVVQLMALAADPHRLYVERGLPSAFSATDPWLYFHPAASHLFQRPREILEMLHDVGKAPAYTPAPVPTFALPVFDPPYVPKLGRPVVECYAVLRTFRPWWWSQRMLAEQERPLDLARTVWLLLGLAAAGGLTLGTALVKNQPGTDLRIKDEKTSATEQGKT